MWNVEVLRMDKVRELSEKHRARAEVTGGGWQLDLDSGVLRFGLSLVPAPGSVASLMKCMRSGGSGSSGTASRGLGELGAEWNHEVRGAQTLIRSGVIPFGHPSPLLASAFSLCSCGQPVYLVGGGAVIMARTMCPVKGSSGRIFLLL